jgi:diketogulonate reductase-like aldo/keto reductase
MDSANALECRRVFHRETAEVALEWPKAMDQVLMVSVTSYRSRRNLNFRLNDFAHSQLQKADMRHIDSVQQRTSLIDFF